MKYFALALMAVLAMASVSMADMSYNVPIAGEAYAVVTETVLDYGKCAYDVHIYGAKTFGGLAIVEGLLGECLDDPALVHQTWVGTAPTETPYLGQVPGGTAPDNPLPEYDTHFLFASGDVSQGDPQIPSVGFETNSMGNENELPDDSEYVMEVLKVNHHGMGFFDTRGTEKDYSFTFAGELDPLGYDLIHVVIECGDLVYLSGGTVVEIEGVLQDAGMCIPIGVPEPGTILMLVAGALCLLGIRRK